MQSTVPGDLQAEGSALGTEENELDVTSVILCLDSDGRFLEWNTKPLMASPFFIQDAYHVLDCGEGSHAFVFIGHKMSHKLKEIIHSHIHETKQITDSFSVL